MSRRRKTKNNKREKELKAIYNNNIVNWDFNEIKKMAEENGIQMFVKAGGKVLEFKSKYDSWICSTTDKNFLKLYHDTKTGNMHFQNIFYDSRFMLTSTGRHDYYKKKTKGTNSVDYVMNKYNNGEIPRFKVN